MPFDIIETETIETACGAYVIDWVRDDDAPNPLDSGVSLAMPSSGEAHGPRARKALESIRWRGARSLEVVTKHPTCAISLSGCRL